MAKALKVGDQVTVKKPIEFARRSPERSGGLKGIQPGDLGTVMSLTDGRSANVEFGGVQTLISTQKLDRAADSSMVSGPASSTDMINYGSRQFIREVANKLLVSGDAENQQSVSIEIKLSELPADIQNQIRTLIRAKLDLDAPAAASRKSDSKVRSKAAAAAATKPRGKRGRPPGVKNKVAASGKKRERKPKQIATEPELVAQ